jgi:hypothetical protein
MSELSEDQIKKSKELFTEAYRLYVDSKYQESLEKYKEVLSLVEPTDDIAAKVTVYTAIAQVHSQLEEKESTKSDEFSEKAIQQLQKIKLSDSHILRQIMSPVRGDLMMKNDKPDSILNREERGEITIRSENFSGKPRIIIENSGGIPIQVFGNSGGVPPVIVENHKKDESKPKIS